ncbi:MAG: gliding motility-associated C-terminal domain-containing protein [Bacteroidetes bacterium]|nr:gliding motility-associated C-terminal domain-containing protein [Bacteroidota bacterium]
MKNLFCLLVYLTFSILLYGQDCDHWLKVNNEISGVQIGDLDVTGNQITVEALINRTDSFPDLYDGGDVVSKHDNPSDANYLLRPTEAQITTDNGFFTTIKSCDIELNKTYHIAMVYDGSTLKFYRNGFLMSQVNASGNLYQNNWITKIGTTANTASPYPADFIGYINEVRIWNVARTQSQIRQYMSQSIPNPSTQAGLLAYYTFNDLKNKQGNSNWDGSILGDAAINQTNPTCSSFIADSCGAKIDKTVNASFDAPDTICINEPVNLVNTSIGAKTYYWSFCQADLNQPPTGKNLGDINSSFSLPTYSDIVSQNNNYYVFVVNNHPGGLTRLDFGNSLLNTPTAVSLGNLSGAISDDAEGIQIVNTGNHWYGIMVGGDELTGVQPQILKIDFGTDITNTNPTTVNWGNVGNMAYPHKLYVFNENNNWYGFTANYNNSTITRFDFGSDFSGTPVGTNLGNFGVLSGPVGLNAIKDNNNWYVFVANSTNSSITRLAFGSSLLSTPTSFNLGNVGGLLHACFDIYIQKYCDQILGFVVNGNDSYNNIIRLDFNNDLTSVPSAVSLGNIGNLSFPHSFSKLFRVGNDLYTIVPNAHNNTLTRLMFSGCNNSNIPGTSQAYPPPISYDSAGVYNISLSVDEGLPTQTSYCKQVVAINCDTICNLKAGFAYQRVTCDPKILQFQDTSLNADSIRWDFGFGKQDTARNPVVAFPGYGKYIVHLYAKTNSGCLDTATDTIDVEVTIDSAIITKDTAICLGSSIQLTAINGLNYCWSPKGSLSDSSIQNPLASPVMTTTYYLNILTANNQPVIRDSVTITVLSLPVVNAGPDDTICLGTTAQLNATGASTYKWQSSIDLSDTTIANPVASPVTTTNFIVTGFDNYGCRDTDNVIITVLDLPDIQLVNDTAICKGGSVVLNAIVAGKNSYRWLPSIGLSDATVFNPVASPAATTKYFVSVSDSNQCVATDSVTVNVLPGPVVSTINDTSVCYGSQVTLVTDAMYANSFSWSPQTGLDNFNAQNPVATALSTTKYYVTADNGYCSEKDSVTLTVLALPDVIAGNDTTVCGNATAQLSAAGALSYSWQPVTGLSDPISPNTMANPGQTTTYFVTGTDVNKCSNIDSVTVNVTPVPAFQLAPQQIVICVGNTTVLAASGGDVFSWSPAQTVSNPGAAATNVYPAETTTYKVIITDTTCKVTDSLFSTVTVDEPPVVSITKSNDVDCINWQAQLTATGGNRFKWSPNQNISNPAISNPVVTPVSDTWYFVEVTSENGCTNKDSILVKSILNPEAKVFEVPSAFTPNHDGLNDCFEVKYWGPADIFDLSVYNRMGDLVFHSNNINACWDGNYKGLPQPQGVYVYKINISSRCSNGLVQKKGTVVLIR